MGLGFLILAAIGLIALGFATGIGWFAIPVVLLAIVAYLAYTLAMRQKGDHFARAESGPRGPDKGTPQDTPGGPTHSVEGYAHEGQANMTPEQARRTTA